MGKDGEIIMYDYVTTKPELNEKTLSEFGITIQHGYLKDAAAKTHKYLKRWKNAAGKWVYQYKGKAREQAIKLARKAYNLDPTDVTNPTRPALFKEAFRTGRGVNYTKGTSGKANSHSGQEGSRLNAGIAAGRKRVSKNKQKQNMTNAIKNKKAMGSSDRLDKPYYNTELFDFGNGIKLKARGVVRTVKKKKK